MISSWLLCKSASFSGPLCPPLWAQKATALIVPGLLSLREENFPAILLEAANNKEITKMQLGRIPKGSRGTSVTAKLPAGCMQGLEDTPQGLCGRKVSWYRDLPPGRTYCIYCPQHISCLLAFVTPGCVCLSKPLGFSLNEITPVVSEGAGLFRVSHTVGICLQAGISTCHSPWEQRDCAYGTKGPWLELSVVDAFLA